MTVTVRALVAGEVDLARQLGAVFQSAFAEDGANPDAPPPSTAHITRLLAREDFHAIVALYEGQVVGGLTAYELVMFQTEHRELFLYDVAVDPPHQRQGVGRALFQFVQEFCPLRGISAFYVAAHAIDEAAVSFYTATGAKRENVAWFVQEFDALSGN